MTVEDIERELIEFQALITKEASLAKRKAKLNKIGKMLETKKSAKFDFSREFFAQLTPHMRLTMVRSFVWLGLQALEVETGRR